MENGQNANVSGWDLSLVTSCNQNVEVRSHHDVMVRRMKNRERQRRYRARKRLEADRKKTHEPQTLPYLESDSMKAITSIPPPKEIEYVVSGRKKETTVDHFTLNPVQTEMPVYGTPVDFITRVHCQRDWKRDARRAHTFKEEDVRGSGPISPLATPANGSQAQAFPSDTKVLGSGCQLSGPTLDNNQDRTVMPSRRHWKEEARNKKS